MSEARYVRDPAAFDTKAYAEATERRHAEGADLFALTAATHPVLHAVFEAIALDNSGEAGHASYSVPLRFRDAAARAEIVLAALTADERETIASGDQDEAAEILKSRVDRPDDRAIVDALLNAFFEDWHEDPTDGEKP